MSEYNSIYITPEELYLRQQGKCWIKVEKDGDDNVKLFCTDGKDIARTDCMLNPTPECIKCLSKNLVKVIKNGVEIKKHEG